MPLQGALPFLTATCIRNDESKITIDAGYHSGLAVGNIFWAKTKMGRVQISLSEAAADSSVAALSQPLGIQKGDELSLANPYTVSKPQIKIYVPVMNLSSESFTDLFNKKILPLTQKKGYMDFHNWWDDSVSYNYVFTNRNNTGFFDSISKQQSRFFLYFSLPSDVGDFVKKELQKDQNIELVASPNEADEVLRVSYSPVSADNKSAGFVFTYNLPFTSVNEPGYTAFCYNYTQVANLMLNDASLSQLSNKIKMMFHIVIRSKTTHWMNEYERR